MPTSQPTSSARCHLCASERAQAAGVFHVDVDHRLLDAWLLASCTVGTDPTAPTTLERMTARLHTTRGTGPAAHRRRSDDRAAARSGPHVRRPGLGQRLCRRHRRIGLL